MHRNSDVVRIFYILDFPFNQVVTVLTQNASVFAKSFIPEDIAIS